MGKSRRKKQKNNIQNIVKKSILKTAVLSLIIALNWAGLSAVMETIAYYNDTEDSNPNIYQAGALDFYLDSPTSNFIPPETVINMKAGDSVSREISVIKETNSNSFQYNAQTVQTGGNIDFCNSLQLEAKLEGELKYSDGLMDFNITPPIVLGEDGKDDWLFIVILPTEAVFTPGEVCQIKFVFDGWQTNLSDYPSGFSDQEEIASSFNAEGVKINKVYYDVDAEHGSESANEWIEIYNPLDNQVDISGWTIEDNNSTDTIPSSEPIPGHGFAMITGSAATWGYWNIPDNVIKIVLDDGEIGNGLSNESDRVILKLVSGSEDDAMSYGADTYAFDPSCPDVAEGHILARIPTGFDTNQASDWKDIGLPEVTVINPNGGEIWWVGRTYPLQWTAANPNGDDSDLSIDIWYSWDSGVTWANIVMGTENDGVLDWRIPLFIDSYYVPSDKARIKVEVWGPENFMVQSWDMSDADFCPPIDFSLLTPEELEMAKALGLVDISGEPVIEEPTLEETPVSDENSPDENPLNEPEDEENGEGEDVIPDDIFDDENIGGEIIDPLGLDPIETDTPEEEGIVVVQAEEETVDDETEDIEEQEQTIEENPIPTENQDGGIIDKIDELIDEVVDAIVEEILPDEPASDEVIDEEVSIEETPVIDETTVIEETAVSDETVVEESVVEEPSDEPINIDNPQEEPSTVEAENPVIEDEETPITEEEPATVPENNTSDQCPMPESGGDGGDGGDGDGGSDGGGSPEDSALSE